MSTNSYPIKEIKDSKAESNVRTSVILAFLLFFCVLISLNFWNLLFHEGGHALADLIDGNITKVLYAHPFTFAGLARPIFRDKVLNHAAGPVMGVLVPLLIFIPLWKRRSTALLPLVMVFPFAAISAGGSVSNIAWTGDYHQIIRLTGLPEAAIVIPGLVMLVIGIFLYLCLFPLLGLCPKDWRVLLVLPAVILLWGGVSVLVAHLVVPGSPIDTIYHEGTLVIWSAEVNMLGYLLNAVVLAVIYFTLFRWIYPRLPSWLRSETVLLTWKDLRIPALSAAACVILGLILIH
jgi:hypothetical protein